MAPAPLPIEREFFDARDDENTDEIPLSPNPPRKGLGWLPLAAAGVLLGVLAGIVYVATRPSPPVPEEPTPDVRPPEIPVTHLAPPTPAADPTLPVEPPAAAKDPAAVDPNAPVEPPVAAKDPALVDPKAPVEPPVVAKDPALVDPKAPVEPPVAAKDPPVTDPKGLGLPPVAAKDPAVVDPKAPVVPLVAEKTPVEPVPADSDAEYARLVKAAKASVQAERFKTAVTSYRRALGLKPDSAEAKAGLGISLVMSDTSYKEAIGLLEAAVKADGGNARAWLALGMAYQNTGRDAAAWVPYKKYLALDPKGASAGEIRAMLQAAGQ